MSKSSFKWPFSDFPERDKRYLETYESEGNLYIFAGRSVSILILSIWALTLPADRSVYYILILVVFFLLGLATYLGSRLRFGAILTFPLNALDVTLLTALIVLPPPIYVEGWSVQINQRLPNYIYLLIYLCVSAMSYSPARILWAGVCSVVSWTAAFLWLISMPETKVISADSIFSMDNSGQAIAEFLDPNAVNFTAWINQTLGIIIITAILTHNVWRSRRNILRQVSIERRRAKLANYFSPNIAQVISENDFELNDTTVQKAAIIFVDMVGFTSISERFTPEYLMELLRDFHQRLAQVVFSNAGTVDKYIGDCVMVHFGALHRQSDDPLRAMKTIVEMIDTINQWNRQRLEKGQEIIRIGIGAHYGDVVVGNIGHNERLEFAVLGDTVNVASRLERATRELGVTAVVSDDLIQAMLEQQSRTNQTMNGFRYSGETFLDGRGAAIAVWTAD